MMYGKEANTELLRAALIGYERQSADLEERISEIKRQLGDHAESNAAPRARVVSAAGRRRMAAAQKKRWAGIHEAASSGAPKKLPAKKKRKLSAEGRARIVEATRKRWEAYRAELSQNVDE